MSEGRVEVTSTSTNHISTFGLRTFERLRDRAHQSRRYAEHHAWGRPISEELAAMSPEEVTLTEAEIDAAEEILKSVVERYNRATDSAIAYQSAKTYERKYRTHKDGVFENIAETSRLIAMWCELAITQVVGLEEAKSINTIHNYGELTMRDKFVTGTAVAVGPNASVPADIVQQVSLPSDKTFDVHALAEELGRLRATMRKEAIEPEQDIAVAEVAQAETAAKQGDMDKALQHLKAAGAWTFDVASKIGVGVATAAIKAAAGW